MLIDLVNRAKEDARLIDRNQRSGDVVDEARWVQFVLHSRERATADAVGTLLNQCRYGKTFASGDIRWSNVEDKEGWRVIVWMFMPTTMPTIGCASALIATVAHAHDMSYEGWSCQLQTKPEERRGD